MLAPGQLVYLSLFLLNLFVQSRTAKSNSVPLPGYRVRVVLEASKGEVADIATCSELWMVIFR